MTRVDLLGIQISCCTKEALNSYIKDVIANHRKEMILNVNVNCMNLAYRNRALKEILNGSYLVFCDGDGIRLAAKALRLNIPEKITYNRWIWDLAKLSIKNAFSWYLIGSEESVIAKAVSVLNCHYPDLDIKGFHSGFFCSDSDLRKTIDEINRVSPDILIMGMGMPQQEFWLANHFKDLSINIALTGGAVFDYVSGKAKMTPDLFYKLKLEWLFRFICEPKRLFNRYIIGNPLFLIRLIDYHLFKIKKA
jgi:N-acetylglucosaminyldiphosphoundecaprenol N-acetyl-beta-D-mannosaminyltransferase